MSLEQLEQVMKEDLTSFKGWVTAREREAVLYAVGVCRTLSAQEKSGWRNHSLLNFKSQIEQALSISNVIH